MCAFRLRHKQRGLETVAAQLGLQVSGISAVGRNAVCDAVTDGHAAAAARADAHAGAPAAALCGPHAHVGGVEHGERAGGQFADQPADGPTVPEQRRLRLPLRPEQPAQAADHVGTSAPATLHPGARHLHVRPAATATTADRLQPAAAGHLLVPAGPAFPPLTGKKFKMHILKSILYFKS
jgi:hypothetical protein